MIAQYIEQQLQALANRDNAQAMAAYMKTTMPFYGVRAPERRFIVKLALRQYPIQKQEEYVEVIKKLWGQPYREEKYAAIDIARAYPGYINMLALSLFETMIREGSWWDFVDDIAINLIGTVLAQYPSKMMPIIELWIQDPNLWIRRTALICQNKFREETDQKRLFAFCLQRVHEKEFFIKKAIGWALREYAKTEPQRVWAFVEKNKGCFSKLSYKEATRLIIHSQNY